jgi:hypothetical protein
MFSKGTKITTLFWIAISGLVRTTIYSIILGILGAKTMKMISYIYRQNKERAQQENSK